MVQLETVRNGGPEFFILTKEHKDGWYESANAEKRFIVYKNGTRLVFYADWNNEFIVYVDDWGLFMANNKVRPLYSTYTLSILPD